MPSDLDRDLARAFARHSAPGGLLETGTVRSERFGIELPVLLRAPPALPQYFAHFCAQHGDKPFLVDGPLRLSFAETYAAAHAAALGLVARHGVVAGECVGIAGRNSANWIVAYMAVLMAGGCATLLNGWWRGGELCEAIRLAPCRLVIADEERAARLDGCEHGATLLPLRHDCPPEQGLAALVGEAPDEAALPEVAGDQRATMLFTSGTTAAPKGVLSDHCAVVQAAMNFAALTLTVATVMAERGRAPAGQPAALLNLPLFHVTGEVPLLLQSFALGRKLAIMPRWDAREAMRLIEAEKVTYFVGVPTMSYELATHPERDRFDLSSCLSFSSGGAPRPVEHVRRIAEALPHGAPVIGYGLTETNAVGCANLNENYMARPASTGRASPPLVEVAILDEHGGKLAPGQTGEIGIRSICNFSSYWGMEEATAEAFTAEGFFRTGDLGYLDEEAFLFIVDRKKDIILRGGENISSAEVESALSAHPDVAEAAVFGLPDPRLGEVPVAVYAARAGRALDPESLRGFVAGRLASFKVPVRFWRLDEPLPRLGTEKVDKRSLRERFAAVWQQETG